ncbi:superoxide dismutase family protein [Altererythrobacter sp. BO-6]|uniref:superoxide dismutase family protein n=1 Tax=Altererythrobacter sp. BO-6 TaxID=2604537 RepID=UPI0013E0EF44|nr:superoxide dismutase family protein [Altererythrobacter sp. BO-6]QIG54403.1 superoxide dismutase family protein [Altererythrobacter sp. BO-6]
MHYRSLITLTLASAISAGCVTTGGPGLEEVASGALIKSDGATAGTARLVRADNSLSLEIQGQGFEAGERALHLHQTGTCEGPAFTSAGGHLNPFGKTHGHLSPDGKHLGDLPNLQIPSSGQFDVTVQVSEDAAAVLPKIFDTDGTAVMIHAGPDDYRTDPTGAAGARIACAVLAS